MCGIAGIISPRPIPDLKSKSKSCLVGLKHRGPDGDGVFEIKSQNFKHDIFGFLAHSRLAIIDIVGGHQPMTVGESTVAFNGEIFNFQELRSKLENQGYKFNSHSDTEVLIRHMEENPGKAGIHQLNGMFAFALFNDSKLILARDRAGIKPIYYHYDQDSGALAFASELLPLVSIVEKNQLKFDTENIKSFFFFDSFVGRRTPFKNIFKLLPGHFLRWENGKIVEDSFWSSSELLVEDNARRTETDYLAQLGDLFQRSMRRQLVSDRTLGFFLSGGIDSSITTALGVRELGKKNVKTFSVAFEDPTFDESIYARAVSDHLGTDHHELVMNERLILDRVEEIISSLDEPLADHSYLPTYLLNEFARKHVTVALGGDGGDELFAGYKTYSAHKLYQRLSRIPGFFQLGLEASKLFPTSMAYQSFDWKLKRFMSRSESNDFRRHLRWMAGTDLPDINLLFTNSNVPDSESKSNFLNEEIERSLTKNNHSLLKNLTVLDFQLYLGGGVLTKADRASMRHGLELRPPFLDNELVDFAFRLPDQMRINKGKTKYLLKKFSYHFLPQKLMDRKKHGFSVPLAKWLAGPLRPKIEEILKSSAIWEIGCFNNSEFTRIAEEHFGSKRDHSKTLWSLLVFERWLKKINT